MKFYQKLDGSVHVSAREYDIAPDTAIAEGQLVKLVDGLVVGVDAYESGAILGIAAENHSGNADAIDPRATSKRIFVIDDPSVVMQCAAPEVTAAGGSCSTLHVKNLWGFSMNDFKGGYVKLVRKEEGSANTDAIGWVRRIVAFSLMKPASRASLRLSRAARLQRATSTLYFRPSDSPGAALVTTVPRSRWTGRRICR